MDGDTTPINDPDHDSISDFSKTARENTGLFGVPTVFETSVLLVCQSMPCETVARQREREEREGSVINVAESMSRRNSTLSHSLQIHREFYSEERDLRDVNEELNKRVLGTNSVHRKSYSTECNMEIQNLERRNS